jgi:hypothetical protein
MKRKVYVTARERRADQIKGFLACPIANVLLWVIWPVIYSLALTQGATTDWSSFALVQALNLALPWLVNGCVLVLAFVFRPQFAIGYVAFIAVAITAATALSCLFVAACFVSIMLSGNSINPPVLEVFAILVLGGLCGLGLAA